MLWSPTWFSSRVNYINLSWGFAEMTIPQTFFKMILPFLRLTEYSIKKKKFLLTIHTSRGEYHSSTTLTEWGCHFVHSLDKSLFKKLNILLYHSFRGHGPNCYIYSNLKRSFIQTLGVGGGVGDHCNKPQGKVVDFTLLFSYSTFSTSVIMGD